MPYKDPVKKQQYIEEHREQQRAYCKDYYKKNKDIILSNLKQIRKTDKHKKYKKDYRLKNIEQYKRKDKEYYNLNRDIILKKAVNKRQKIKLKVITYYSDGKNICNCCYENHLEFLTIDHINGNGTKHRNVLRRQGTLFYEWLINNNYPTGFQVLCFNCNMAKRNKENCPHKKMVDKLLCLKQT